MNIINSFTSEYLEEVLQRYCLYLIEEEGVKKQQAIGICQGVRNKYRLGTFGICIICEQQISPKILIFFPDTSYCHVCDSKVSKRRLASRGRSKRIDSFDCKTLSDVYNFWPGKNGQ